ncbi:MAG: DinB family protein [Aeoliella sp.]
MTMSQIEQIAMLCQHSFSGPAWHGPSVKEVVSDVTAQQAAAAPALGRFSIWQHLLHMIFWKDQITCAMHGELMPRSADIAAQDNWPTVSDTGESAWQATMAELSACEQRLQQALANFPESRLTDKVGGRAYDFAFALYSVPCHDHYHAAQIVLLKKGLS